MKQPETPPPDSPPVETSTPYFPTALLDDLLHRAAEYASRTCPASTRKTYEKDCAAFEIWCASMGLNPLPAIPATVATYLVGLTGQLAVATISRRLAAIATAHRRSGLRLDTRHPLIFDLLRGIRRIRGAMQRRATPTTTSVVQAMVATCDASLIGLRDRALMLAGFAAALRPSEIAALGVADIAIVSEGMRVTAARSKTGRESMGETVGVVRTGTPSCPVAALGAWLAAAAITEGRVFRRVDRHGRVGEALASGSVGLIIKKRVALIGLKARDFSGNSLRVGLATSAADSDVEERIIRRQVRHRSRTVLRGHIRGGDEFTGNASGRVGL